jgi:hypothetical protein
MASLRRNHGPTSGCDGNFPACFFRLSFFVELDSNVDSMLVFWEVSLDELHRKS